MIDLGEDHRRSGSDELRLQAALEAAHRARLAFLREDFFDGDCARCAQGA